MRELVRVWAADQTFRCIFDLLDTARHLIEADMVRAPALRSARGSTLRGCLRVQPRMCSSCSPGSSTSDMSARFGMQRVGNSQVCKHHPV